MKKWSCLTAFVWAVAWWPCVISARGQTLERDTTITGPRGRTVERQVEIQRRPGSIDREFQIKRPGGTFERQVQIQRSPAMRAVRGPGLGGPWRGGPWFPRPVVVAPAVPAFGLGLFAVPSFNFAFGGGGVGPVGPVAGPMGPGVPAAGVPPPPDQVALMTQRLQSFYPSNRKEAAYTLGRLGDPRAVPSLVHALKYDMFHDVRIASAIALGEIGGSEAAITLERCSIYDKRDDVRKAATTALARLNAKANAEARDSSRVGNRPGAPMPPPEAGSPFRGSAPAAGSGAEPAGASPDIPPVQGEAPTPQPPPPPTPVVSGPGRAAGG
jgi:hypothetical protein